MLKCLLYYADFVIQYGFGYTMLIYSVFDWYLSYHYIYNRAYQTEIVKTVHDIEISEIFFGRSR